MIQEISRALLTLILTATAGAIFETMDDGDGAGFMAGLCAACCILGAIGRIFGLMG